MINMKEKYIIGKETKLNKQKFITKGVESKVVLLLQLFMWQCIAEMPHPRDYLQVFRFSLEGDYQKITHTQEIPEFSREYLLRLTDAPFFVGRIFVIEEDDHITMLLAEEYGWIGLYT